MSFRDNQSYFSQARVVPVLTPSSVEAGVAVSRVLFEAGLPLLEITLRTACGLETIAALRQSLPALLLGAGSVLTPEQGEAAIQSGARFLVSPGCTEALLTYAADCSVPFLPGAATPSEIMRLQAVGCDVVKLFPAQSLGGIAYLRSLAGPLSAMKFCPTGGIDTRLAREYLQLPNVLAVGGSWMLPDALLIESRWAEIRQLAAAAAAL
jgi:2-dehydro-3-deoxyphosphogluconate aldolase / (4S)-4-hydroxy-2-oxoglutarate aldolase